jgi:hypothetical protein
MWVDETSAATRAFPARVVLSPLVLLAVHDTSFSLFAEYEKELRLAELKNVFNLAAQALVRAQC